MQISTIDTTTIPHVLLMSDALPTMFCDKLIAKFEANENRVQVHTDFKDMRHFIEVNISQHWQDEHDLMVGRVQEAWKVYMTYKHVQYDVEFPRHFGYEQFRMKRYLPNGSDQFGLHTDVGNYASARRFLSFLWYLNTVDQGGETGFGKSVDNPDLIIPARKANLLMFPPLWTHPHWGAKVLSGPKYIVSGYLHYI
jgi:hypothetical protein